MGFFGRLKKVFEKVKNVAKKVWGGIKGVVKKVLPIASKIAPAIADKFVPGSGEAVKRGLTVAEHAVNGDYGGALEEAKNISWK
jgi:hypothetical protein